MKNYLLFLLSFFLCVLNVSAQKYEIECARGDSANVYPASIEKMDYEGRVDTFWNVASKEVAFRVVYTLYYNSLTVFRCFFVQWIFSKTQKIPTYGSDCDTCWYFGGVAS